MRKDLPKSNVKKNYKYVLNTFVKNIVEQEETNIISIFLTGSFARGEATENSDLDIWCIFKHLNTSTLSKVGDIVRNLPINYDKLEVNSQCITLDEFNSSFFSKFTFKPIVALEGVLLYGNELDKDLPSLEPIENLYKEMMSEILLSIRHYISVNEPVEKLTHNKIKTWVLKPLMFALRLERYFSTQNYPLTSNDLLNTCANETAQIIEYFLDEKKWLIDIFNDYSGTLNYLHETTLKLIFSERNE